MFSKVQFTNEQRELLISEVQSRPILWNDRHPEYKKTDKTNKMWEKIGKVVGFSGTIVKAKWKNLKDKFRVELQKIPIVKVGSHSALRVAWSVYIPRNNPRKVPRDNLARLCDQTEQQVSPRHVSFWNHQFLSIVIGTLF
ncbi:unnamed protein product [Macrosiphum euphorbiae]|uniref:MADF domain-containing protein n=1 Tax=Macrosiphum euphorbiae TaxID=13131 RepID=A0AAV0WI79_9HEMI|nr:unnamed protein product [Macrosiphum euphorbiae]